MSAKKSLVVILKIIFVFSSLQFLREAFYKWDGYFYYMQFINFLPDLSLVYIVYTFLWAILALILWLGFVTLVKIIPKSLVNIGYEHLITVFIIGIVFLTIKQIFFKGISLTGLTGLNYLTNIIIITIFVTAIVWSVRKYIGNILSAIDNRITPLVWIFAFVLIISLPLSIANQEYFKAKSANSSQSTSMKQPVRSSAKRPPNIILVIMDAMTALDMQLYGYARPTTPFISEWAKDAVVFNRAYSSSNWTTPSTMSIMTGQRPWTHKVWYRAYYNPVESYENNLAEILKVNGFHSYSFVQNPYAHPDVLGIGEAFSIKDPAYTFSMSRGLSDKIGNYFADRPIVSEWVLQIKPFGRLFEHFTEDLDTTPKPPELVYNDFIRSVSKIQPPYFLWLHLWAPHALYLPPRPYIGLFGDAEKFSTSAQQITITGTGGAEYPPERQPDIDVLRKRYDEFILYSDKQFELFISQLSQIVDMSNTIIILTSDHGESFSHGYQEHDGPHLYEQLVRLPLIVKLPSNRNGRTIDMPVEQTDIAPTILELAGIPAPEWIEGRSLVPLIEGKALEPRPIYSMQLIKNRSFGHPITRGTIAVWSGDYKLINYLEDRKTLLFNLQSDQGEALNLAEEKSGISQNLIRLINENLSNANADRNKLK